MNKVRLGDYVKIKTGKLDANASSPDGEYPFFTCAVEPLKIDSYSYDCECVLVAGNGDLNVKYYDGKFDAYQRTYIIESKDKTRLSVPYLYRFLDNYIDTLRNQSIGGVIKYIKLGNLTEAPIDIPTIETQYKTIRTLSFLDSLIEKVNKQKEKLDELVKSRFVEMFGDPVLNTKKWEIQPVINECECMVPGRDKPKSFTGSIPWITIDDLIVNGITYYSKQGLGLTKEEIKQVNRKTIPVGSVIMSCVGNLGVSSIAGTDMIINQQLHSFQCGNRINCIFLMYNLTYRKDYMNKWASNTTVLYMNKTICNSIPIMLPPISLQNQFAEFVAQVEKQKADVQKSIDKLEILKKSLMQDYFG